MKKKIILIALAIVLFGSIEIPAQENKFVPADRWGEGRRDQIDNFNKNINQSVFAGKNLSFITGIENSLEKVYRDKYWFKGEFTDRVEIACARNEFESFQLAVIPVIGASLSGVTITFSDLIHEKNDARIGKENIKSWIVGYVKTEASILPAFTGEWPDPLLEYKSFNVPGDELQPVWVEIYVPPSTPAGKYSGYATISAAGSSGLDVVIRLRVRDFTLPEEQVFRTCTWVFPEPLRAWYGAESEREMFTKYCSYFLAHKINPLNLGSSYYDKNDFTMLDANISLALKQGLTIFQIPRLEGDELIRFCNHLKEEGWFDKAMIYGYMDEPAEEDYPAFREDSKKIRAAVPDLKIFMAESPHPGLYGSVDVWWASMADENRAYVHERLAAGDEVWWYRCGIPVRSEFTRPYSEYPSDALVDRPGIDMRILYWMTWKFNMTPATFFFCGNLWGDSIPKGWPSAVSPLLLRASGDEVYSGTRNGDGWVVYPGPEGPLPSMRLKCMRDGIEDYEYLWVLKKEFDRLPADFTDREKLIHETETLLSVTHELIVDTNYYVKDPARLFLYREKIAGQIVKLRGNGGKAGM